MTHTPDDHSNSVSEPAAVVSDLSLAAVERQFESVFQPAPPRGLVAEEPLGEKA
jgi:hypothetical protein